MEIIDDGGFVVLAKHRIIGASCIAVVQWEPEVEAEKLPRKLEAEWAAWAGPAALAENLEATRTVGVAQSAWSVASSVAWSAAYLGMPGLAWAEVALALLALVIVALQFVALQFVALLIAALLIAALLIVETEIGIAGSVLEEPEEPVQLGQPESLEAAQRSPLQAQEAVSVARPKPLFVLLIFRFHP